jgi:MYXO-CTERM domain-containing protein
VQFDVDSIYSESYVYAEIYLSADGTSWEHLYSTDDFAVWGSDPDDDYEVETELVEGYSTALYDVLVEIYDADTGELVDEYGPNESPLFSVLPLEDSGRDGVVVVPPPPAVVHDGGGGAVSWLGLAGLIGALAARRRRRLTA